MHDITPLMKTARKDGGILIYLTLWTIPTQTSTRRKFQNSSRSCIKRENQDYMTIIQRVRSQKRGLLFGDGYRRDFQLAGQRAGPALVV